MRSVANLSSKTIRYMMYLSKFGGLARLLLPSFIKALFARGIAMGSIFFTRWTSRFTMASETDRKILRAYVEVEASTFKLTNSKALANFASKVFDVAREERIKRGHSISSSVPTQQLKRNRLQAALSIFLIVFVASVGVAFGGATLIFAEVVSVLLLLTSAVLLL